jgi:hypothetical protein
MRLRLEFVLAGLHLGMCAGHLYPALLEQPTMIALDLVISLTHCGILCHHYRRRMG